MKKRVQSIFICTTFYFYIVKQLFRRFSSIFQILSRTILRDRRERKFSFSDIIPRICAHGARREKNGPVPISAGRDPISPTKWRPSLAYALSPARSLNAQFSSSTRAAGNPSDLILCSNFAPLLFQPRSTAADPSGHGTAVSSLSNHFLQRRTIRLLDGTTSTDSRSDSTMRRDTARLFAFNDFFFRKYAKFH